MSNFILYKATSPSNKIYIGITCRGLKIRIQSHKSAASKGSKYKFHKAIRKYKIENIIFEIILSNLSEIEAKDKEKEYILKYNSFKKGYNSTLGGEGQLGITNFKGKTHSLEERKRISERNKGNKYALGIKRTEKQKLAVSIAQKGKKRTNEQIMKHKLTISKPVICITDGCSYINGTTAAKFYNIDKSTVYRCLNGRYKQAKGYIFQYVN